MFFVLKRWILYIVKTVQIHFLDIGSYFIFRDQVGLNGRQAYKSCASQGGQMQTKEMPPRVQEILPGNIISSLLLSQFFILWIFWFWRLSNWAKCALKFRRTPSWHLYLRNYVLVAAFVSRNAHLKQSTLLIFRSRSILARQYFILMLD
jgi:hypothetical protein